LKHFLAKPVFLNILTGNIQQYILIFQTKNRYIASIHHSIYLVNPGHSKQKQEGVPDFRYTLSNNS